MPRLDGLARISHHPLEGEVSEAGGESKSAGDGVGRGSGRGKGGSPEGGEPDWGRQDAGIPGGNGKQVRGGSGGQQVGALDLFHGLAKDLPHREGAAEGEADATDADGHDGRDFEQA